MSGIPFLSISEFIRAKLKTWLMCVSRLLHHCLYSLSADSCSRGSERDAQDIIFFVSRYWNSVDMNRIPEHDMNHFVEVYGAAASGWAALKRKYGM